MDQEGGASQSPSTSTEPVRSRWSPKPEQILILESIFNSGIVNPPKDETVRIRKMLEKFGAVGDTNVFYWFQNRRSRSRRRQRQLQAATAVAATSRGAENHQNMTTMSMHHPYSNSEIDLGFGSLSNSLANNFLNGSSSSQVSSFFLDLSSSSGGCESNNGMENLFRMYGHESNHYHQQSSNAASVLSPPNQNVNFHYQEVTVFINGVPTEVTKGAINMKATFGEDLVLLHSSGLPLSTDEFGFLMHSLQHGQAYFLVPRQT
ncbi:WUSCHEL-related homeobox 12 [Cardamine amara subsp. amara]|uniref:WUSCHEL-related homeobox 12 n=1 Tax=Cardamine amara subsp. amara TaxID=228776 RepID=A0ABD0ZVW0_CARAN